MTAFPTSPNLSASGLVLQADGKAVLAGSNTAPGGGLALARYLTADHALGTTASHTTLSAPAAQVGAPATLTATVTAAGTPTGTVTFLEGSTVLGAAPVGSDGTAIINPSSLPIGKHTITALYSGDAHCKGSSGVATLTITRATTTLLLSISGGSSILGIGPPETLTANFSSLSSLTPTGTVTFLDGNKVLGTAAVIEPSYGGIIFAGSPQATFDLSSLPAGKHTFTARYSGDQNFAAGTGTLTITLPLPGPPPL